MNSMARLASSGNPDFVALDMAVHSLGLAPPGVNHIDIRYGRDHEKAAFLYFSLLDIDIITHSANRGLVGQENPSGGTKLPVVRRKGLISMVVVRTLHLEKPVVESLKPD